jgi:8-oxo-dGTP diphosphatase
LAGKGLKKVRVVAAIIKRGDTVLATQRGYGEFKDWWEFPGGKIEPGETPEDAILREIREELDTKIEIVRPVIDVSYDYDTFHLDMRCFLCKLSDEGFTLLEHESAAWLDSTNLDTVNWLPADAEVITAIREQGIL